MTPRETGRQGAHEASLDAPNLKGEVASMVMGPLKPWGSMSRVERREALEGILAKLERRRQSEPPCRTTGEWWDSAGYMQAAAFFIYSVLEAGGKLRPQDGPH
jgi:hypothetical protein